MWINFNRGKNDIENIKKGCKTAFLKMMNRYDLPVMLYC